LTDVKRRKLRYFGHVIRKPGNCLEKDIIQGKLPGTEEKEDLRYYGLTT